MDHEVERSARTLGDEELASVTGGMVPLYDDGTGNKARPGPAPDGAHGGAQQDYAASDGSMRYGAGPWGSGYGSPTGPWP